MEESRSHPVACGSRLLLRKPGCSSYESGNEAVLLPSRQYQVSGRMQRLLTAAEIVDLGLDRMGAADAVGWEPREISLFEQGLDENKRDFEHIARTLLPAKGPLRVASFYYNVWKTRAILQAKEWYRRRDEVRGCCICAVEISRRQSSMVNKISSEGEHAVAFRPPLDALAGVIQDLHGSSGNRGLFCISGKDQA